MKVHHITSEQISALRLNVADLEKRAPLPYWAAECNSPYMHIKYILEDVERQ